MNPNELRPLAEELRGIKGRLKALESGPGGNRSVTAGGFFFYDEAGVVRVEVGRREDGTYGVTVYDNLGNVLGNLG